MECDSVKTKEVVLCFKRNALLYDVENYSYVEGDVMVTDNDHARHQVFDIGQCGNVDRVTRVLNLSHAEVVEMLYPYTKREINDNEYEGDDVLRAPEVYRVALNLPSGFSSTTVELLRELIHEYMVCRVLADWMSIVNPQSEGNWVAKLEVVRKKMSTALLSRRGKVLRRMKPF